MAQRNRGNSWAQGGPGVKSGKKKGSNPAPAQSAEDRFQQAQAKMQESAQKHLEHELELSSEEEELETDNIFDSVVKNYAQIGGKSEDLGKTQNFLDNIFRSDAAICLICISTIKRAESIWNCGSCCGSFHLLCIQRWGKDSIAHQKLAEDERMSPTKKEYFWPCPKCRKNYPPAQIPQRYECFCGQLLNPPYQPWLVPHSCGQVCGRGLVPACGHSCLLLCHPGPCPPCPKMIRAKCFCGGGDEKMVRCSYKEWSCEQKCSKSLSCKKHKCETVCHPGNCPPCSKTSMMKCDCQKLSRLTPCAELTWKCDKVCGNALDCGMHSCELVCHKGDCGPCPRTLPRTCPCGREETVISCTQEVSTCGSTCGKLLDCGLHTCNQRCHRGSCGVCMEFLEKNCRCGLYRKEIACIKEYLCDTKCKGMRDCGVHPCNRKCCDGECRPCEKICGKTLRCGQHKCTSVCHRGQCYPCVQTKQLSCRCGSTVITVPCGIHRKKKNLKCNKFCLIPPECHHLKREEHKCHVGPCPPCRQPCQKPRSCGHPCTLSCHSSVLVNAIPNYKPATPWDRVTAPVENKELPCPPCEFPVEVWCFGKDEKISLPCYRAICHSYGGVCHEISGAPDDESAGKECMECTEDCEASRLCSHPCPLPCHPPPSPVLWDIADLIGRIRVKGLSGAQRRKAKREKLEAQGLQYRRPARKNRPSDTGPPDKEGTAETRLTEKGATGRVNEGAGPSGNQPLHPLGHHPGTPKRGRLVESAGTTPDKPSQKRQRQEGDPRVPFCSVASGGGKMALVLRDYPKGEISEEQAMKIQRELIRRFPAEDPVRFSGVFREQGALVFLCLDRRTVQWLEKTVTSLPSWELVVRPWAEVRRSARILMEVPQVIEDMTPREVLQQVAQQNREVRTREWSVISSTSSERGRLLVLSVPEGAYEELRGRNMTLFLGFSRLTVRVLRAPRGPNLGSEGPGREIDGGNPSGKPPSQ